MKAFLPLIGGVAHESVFECCLDRRRPAHLGLYSGKTFWGNINECSLAHINVMLLWVHSDARASYQLLLDNFPELS